MKVTSEICRKSGLIPLSIVVFTVAYYYPVYLSSYYHHDDVLLALSVPGRCRSFGQFDFSVSIGRPLSPWFLCAFRSFVEGIDQFSRFRIVLALLAGGCGGLTYAMLRRAGWKALFAAFSVLLVIISPSFLVYNFWTVASNIMVPYSCAVIAMTGLLRVDHLSDDEARGRPLYLWSFVGVAALVVGLLVHQITLSIFVALQALVVLRDVGKARSLFVRLTRNAAVAVVAFLAYSAVIKSSFSLGVAGDFGHFAALEALPERVIAFWTGYWPSWSMSWVFVAADGAIAAGATALMCALVVAALMTRVLGPGRERRKVGGVLWVLCAILLMMGLYMGAGIGAIVTKYPISLRHAVGMVVVSSILIGWSLQVFDGAVERGGGRLLPRAARIGGVALFLLAAIPLHQVLVRDMVAPAVAEFRWLKANVASLVGTREDLRKLDVRFKTRHRGAGLVTDEIGGTTLSFPQDTQPMIILALRELGHRNVRVSVYLENWKKEDLCCGLPLFLGSRFELKGSPGLDANDLNNTDRR